MKKTLATVATVVTLTTMLATPALVSAHGDHSEGIDLGHRLEHIKNSIAGGAQRLYLRAIPGPKSGQAVVGQMFMAMENIESLTSEIKMDFNVNQGGQSLGSGNFMMTGPMQISGGNFYNPESIKQEMHISGEIKMEGMQFSAAGDVIFDGASNTSYARLTEVPLPLQQVQNIKNQWMRFEATQSGTVSYELTPDQEARIEAAVKELYESAELTEARKEKWNGDGVFVLDMTFTEDDFMNYFNVYEEIARENNPEMAATTAQEKENMKQFLASMGPFRSTLWIDRSTFYLRHMEMPMSINFAELQNQLTAMEETQQPETPMPFESMDLNFSGTFDNFNQPVTINIPSDARPAEEVMQEIMGGMMGPGLMPPTGGVQTMPYPAYPTQEVPELTEEQLLMLQEYGY